MEFKLLTNEIDDLVSLMTCHTWEYHGNQLVTEEKVRKAFQDGYYKNDRETFWIMDYGVKVGILIINDIDDTIPLFDIRLDHRYRGKGYGVKSLTWLQQYLFEVKDKIRIESYTRADNHAMRKCFTKAGFVKEGYLRRAWENGDGTISDSVVYGAIQSDWKNNKITPIEIDKVPY